MRFRFRHPVLTEPEFASRKTKPGAVLGPRTIEVDRSIAASLKHLHTFFASVDIAVC